MDTTSEALGRDSRRAGFCSWRCEGRRATLGAPLGLWAPLAWWAPSQVLHSGAHMTSLGRPVMQ